jgi:uncharacterized damage-inducible protein DinB
MKSFFNELLEYNRQMNQQIIMAMVQHKDKVSEKSQKWMNHILNAQELYHTRIEPAYKAYGSWHMRELEELESVNDDLHHVTGGILTRFELDTMIHYTTTKGVPMQNTIQDIVFHIVNHGTYHRGQIAADFRNTGLEPLVTDYVVWKRYQ